ncbi:hypothetical protein HGRIS_010062 [Hohenbuehelia grisea]|uniref:1-acyl-sn-glycerol-3-phosphate acyltransferase n=1 Tax=Hohenbuehelia grisea TaxID=104357 RepID=A0ABR3J3L5_9AGAR
MSFLGSIIKPLAYLSLPALLLRMLGARSPTVRYYTRVGLYLGAISVVATTSIVVAIGMSVVGQRHNINYVTARMFYYLAGTLLDIDFDVEGEEHLQTRPAVLMGNHQSMLDVLALGRVFPKHGSIVAKKELRLTPVGPFMAMSRSIWLDRGNNARAVRSLEAAGETMQREKISLWIFPEGTRHLSKTPDMLPLKKGGFHLAIQAGIPITPVVTESYWHLYRKGAFESGKLKIRVLPPIPTTGLTAADVPALATRVRDQMLAALREISVHAPSDASADEPSEATPPAPSGSSSGPAATRTDSSSPSPAQPRESEHRESVIGVAPDVSLADEAPKSAGSATTGSGESLNMLADDARRQYQASETGTETSTEEDEGMVLVGRPE